MAKIVFLVAALLCVCVCSAAANLVVNGDFSLSSNGQPASWEAEGDANLVTQELRAMTDAAGLHFARLSCTRFERQAPAAHAMLAQAGQVRLLAGHTYEFSCQMRAEGIAGRSVSVAIRDTKIWANCGLDTALLLSDAWQTYRKTFKATRDVGPSSRLQLWFGETGALYVADVKIVETPEAEVEFANAVEAGGGKNLVPNASFELGTSGWSSLGTSVGWGNLDHLHGLIETNGGAVGRNFLRIPVGGDATPLLYFDYFVPVMRREINPLAASEGWIKVVPGDTYALSCFMRGSRDELPAVLGVMMKDPAQQGNEHRHGVRLTKDWQRYSMTFKADQRYLFVLAGPALQQEVRADVDVDGFQLERGDQATEFQARSSLEMALEPSAPAGIFVDGQGGGLWLTVCNEGPERSSVNVKFHVTDFEDQPVALPDCACDIPAHSSLRQNVPIPADWKGYYKVTALAGAHEELKAEMRLAIVPPRTDQDSVCGINHPFVSADLIHLASKAGISWYRDWSLKWQHMEPAKGEYHWELGEAQIDRVLREGPSVLPLLPPFPSADWSSEAPAAISTTGHAGPRARQAWGPKDPRELAGFIQQAVTRYKDRIHIWEFLNEPIYTDYSLPARANNMGARTYGPADYVALLATASGAMRATDPACKVIGGIAGEPQELTEDVLDAGILKYVDIFNLHIYPSLRSPESFAPQMDKLLASMEAHGGRKPIWITEFSYYGADNLPRRPFIPDSDDWAGERLLASERQCADYTTRFFAVMLSHGAQKIFIHSGASGAVNDPNMECALFDYGGAPRKLLPALAVLTQALGPAPQCAGTKDVPNAAHVAGFETGQHSVLLLWRSEDEHEHVSLPSLPNATWMDAMGRKMAKPPGTLSTSLTYLLGRPGKAAEMLQQIRPGK